MSAAPPDHGLFDEPILGAATRFCLDRMGPVSGKRVLDLGCGRGDVGLHLASQGARVVGLDRKEVAAPAAASITFVRGEAESLPFEDASFDVVFSRSALQYMDFPRASAEMLRVLRPGGDLHLIHNLPGNAFARLFRAVRPLLATRDEHRSYLRSIQGYTSREEILARFSRFDRVEERAHHLLRFLTAGADSAAGRPITPRILDRGAAAVDRALLARLPWTARFAWIAAFVFQGLRPQPSREEG